MNATLPGLQRLDVQTADLDWQTHADTCCMKCGLLNVSHTNPLQIHLDTKKNFVPQRLPAAGPASERQRGPARNPAQTARSCLATPGPTLHLDSLWQRLVSRGSTSNIPARGQRPAQHTHTCTRAHRQTHHPHKHTMSFTHVDP